jgi:hypothetical protein
MLIMLEQSHLFNELTNLENAGVLETVCLLEALSDKLIPRSVYNLCHLLRRAFQSRASIFIALEAQPSYIRRTNLSACHSSLNPTIEAL